MASDTVLPVTVEQPTEGGLHVLTMSDAEIKNLISATHVPAEKDFDANSLFVVVEIFLKRFRNMLQGKEDPKILEEEVLRDTFGPTLGTVEQLSLEMAHKALDIETAHRTTMSILNKLSSYSWQTKAVLALATFALDSKKYNLATAQGDSSTQPIKSVEISKRVPITFYLQTLIYGMLTATECTFELEKEKSLPTDDTEGISLLSSAIDHIPVLVYWIIMTVVAWTTLMFRLTSNGNNTQELLSLANKIGDKLLSLAFKNDGKLRSKSLFKGFFLKRAERRKELRRIKEFLQTPDEVTEVLKALIFGKEDVQPLIDCRSDELVSLDVLKNKGVLLFISGLHISRDDILVSLDVLKHCGGPSFVSDLYISKNGSLILKPIYEKITDINIIWIPIVVEWTDELRKKFDMLRSGMPWYVPQYFSQLAGIKFIKEEWHFENDPIVVAMDAQGNVQVENLLPKTRTEKLKPRPRAEKRKLRPRGPHAVSHAAVMRPRGPHAIEDYTLYYGGKDSRWIEQFSEKGNAVAEDPIIKEAPISVELSRVEKVNNWNPFWRSPKTRKKNDEIKRILPSFENEESGLC